MLRSADLEWVPRPVVALADEYPARFVDPRHSHTRGQLLFAAAGVMSVVTDQASFVIPPQRAIWVPAGVSHELTCRSAVSVRTLYFEPGLDLPDQCQVFEVSELLRALIWVVAIAALGWLLYLLSRHLGWFKGAFKFDRVKPDVLFGMDLRPESLPDDIPAAARALLVGGDMRAALALLYRGALSVLVHERDVEVRTGDTEEDCVRRVAKAGPPALATYFQSLVSAWGLIAYAGRRPERAEAERLISAWAGHFTPAPAAPAAPDLKAAPA